MKTFYLSVTLSLIIITISCNDESSTNSKQNNDSLQDKYFTAVVEQPKSICGTHIKFFGDTTGISSILFDDEFVKYRPGNLQFVALFLPDSLNIDGLKIRVKFRKPIYGEFRAYPAICLLPGPEITILSAYRVREE